MEILHNNLTIQQPSFARPQNSTILVEYEALLDIIWTVAFSSIVVSAVIGNATVIWIVIGHKRMWSVTNYYLLNLTIADIMMATLNVIFSFIFMRDSQWDFGVVYCVINYFTSLVAVSSSVMSLLAITLDRRRAIMSPLKPKATRWAVLCAICAIWVFCMILALPITVHVYTYVGGDGKEVCIAVWPDGPQGYSKYDFYYNVIYMMLTYILPLLIMGACFLQMGRKLWGGEAIGEDTPGLKRSRVNKQKVVKMFGVMISIFCICWLPYHLYFLYSYMNPDVYKSPYTKHVYLGFYWLAMSNCSVNPIIYYWMNRRFREYFNYVLKCTPQKLKSNLRRITNRYRRNGSFSEHQSEQIALRRLQMNLHVPVQHRCAFTHQEDKKELQRGLPESSESFS